MKSLGGDFTSTTKKLDSPGRALRAERVVSCWSTQYRSKAPRQGAPIRLELIECDYSNPSDAQASLKHFLTTAHPDAGHSYESEAVFVTGATVFRLIGACLISRENFDLVARDLAAALQSNFGAIAAAARCRCGGGCAQVDRTNP